MRKNIRNLVRQVFQFFPADDPVYEFGSYQVEGQQGFADLRPFFPGKEYVGCDFRDGPGVDRVENIEEMTLPDESVGTALLLDTLEHVQRCPKACGEVFRVIKPGGSVLTTSVMDFKIHDHPYDYWRFTPEAFNLMLEPFPVRIIGSQGMYLIPHTVFAIGFKRNDPPDVDLDAMARAFREAMKSELSPVRKVKHKLARLLTKKMERFMQRNRIQLRLYEGSRLTREVQVD